VRGRDHVDATAQHEGRLDDPSVEDHHRDTTEVRAENAHPAPAGRSGLIDIEARRRRRLDDEERVVHHVALTIGVLYLDIVERAGFQTRRDRELVRTAEWVLDQRAVDLDAADLERGQDLGAVSAAVGSEIEARHGQDRARDAAPRERRDQGVHPRLRVAQALLARAGLTAGLDRHLDLRAGVEAAAQLVDAEAARDGELLALRLLASLQTQGLEERRFRRAVRTKQPGHVEAALLGGHLDIDLATLGHADRDDEVAPRRVAERRLAGLHALDLRRDRVVTVGAAEPAGIAGQFHDVCAGGLGDVLERRTPGGLVLDRDGQLRAARPDESQSGQEAASGSGVGDLDRGLVTGEQIEAEAVHVADGRDAAGQRGLLAGLDRQVPRPREVRARKHAQSGEQPAGEQGERGIPGGHGTAFRVHHGVHSGVHSGVSG